MARSRDGDLWISAGRCVPEHELLVQRVRAGGPGGQHVNKAATKVVLRFRPGSSSALGAEERARVVKALAGRLSRDGELVIHASEHRSAERNLEAARDRLADLLRRGLTRPKPRRPTRPTRASRDRRLDAKRRAGDRKRARRAPAAE